VLVAGTGPRKTLPMVARHADIWHAQFPSHPGEVAPSVARLVECCASVGRDPETIGGSLGIEPAMLETRLREHADAYGAMGFREFTLGINGPDFDVSGVREWLAWRDAH